MEHDRVQNILILGIFGQIVCEKVHQSAELKLYYFLANTASLIAG